MEIFRTAGLGAALVPFMLSPAAAASLTIAHTPETILAYPTAFGDVDAIALGDCLEGLVAENDAGDAIPGQASSWTVSTDGLTYVFALRDNVVWSNGDPVTAGDFVAGFDWLFDPANALQYAYLQFPIRNAALVASGALPMSELGIRALNEKTLEITLERPAPFFLQGLTHSTAYPLPTRLMADLQQRPLTPEDIVCNSAYVIAGIDGETTRATRSPSYYAASDVAVDSISYLRVADVPSALDLFAQGQIDIFYDLPVSANEWIDAHLSQVSQVVPFLGLTYLAINVDKPPFDDPALRRALSMAIDREVLDPQGLTSPRTAAYGLVPPGTANYDGVTPFLPEWSTWTSEQRQDTARAILAGLGYGEDNPLVVEIRYAANRGDGHQNVVQAIADMWERIGVTVKLYSDEGAAHLAALQTGNFDIGRSTWFLDYSDPANILELMSSASEFNTSGYDNAALDALLDQASRENDLVARAELLAQAEQLIMRDMPLIPLTWVAVRNLVSERVEGMRDNAKNVHRARWLSLSQ